jgi:serpin B
MRSTLGMSTKTMEEINQTYLKLMSEMVPVDERVTMEIANSVWVEKRLTANEPFITALQTWYLAELFDIDVTDAGAVEMVNNWIAEKTHDKITDMLDYLNPDLAMLLINAIYFNGKWRYRFDEAETKQEPFYYTPDATVNVSMMNQTANLKVVTTGEATIAEIPYGQGNYNMIVVLPADNLTTEEIVGSLTPARWEEWMDQLSWNTHEVELKMPKFKYGYKRVLNDDLIDLGMEAAFSEAADFSNISDQDLFISRVIHQTFIENDEQGTEAAAATVVEICFSSADPSPMVYEVHLDHPFLYFIRESSTGTILFMGRVNDPTIN